ncbi:MAG: transporter, partial [Bacteroidota bacterium]|nr:transporter [Bacteroidota bacterium]
VSPYKNTTGLMFRLVPYKDGHTLTDVTIQVTCSFQVEENGEMQYKFYNLNLERNRVDSLAMNWTVVHPIDEGSPLINFTSNDMKVADLELYVLMRGFDDVYSNTVLQRTSYTYDEIIFEAKFVPMYHESEDGKTTILEIDKIHEYQLLG